MRNTICNKLTDLSGASKFDTTCRMSLSTYKSMLSPVSELLSWNDMTSPAPSYAASYLAWKEAAEETMDAVIKSSDTPLTQKEEECAEVGLQIGFGILEKFLEKARAVGWGAQTPEARLAEVERILALPQVPQRTPEWYAQGKQVLTASEFATLYGSPRALRQLAFQKVAQPQTQQTNRLACLTCEMGPFDWGVRFEPVVKLILAEKWGARIMDSGRIMHPTEPLLAASPDGFIVEATDSTRIGRLLEIKCPISREIGGAIPFEYWCQMQIQMEVTGIEECEYVEVKIDSISPKRTDLSGAAEGHVWLFQDLSSCRMLYAYTEAEKVDAEAKGYDLIETIPWRLADMYTKTVTRDRGWFRSTATMREEFWEIVGQARRAEIQPFEAKSKGKVVVIKEPECRIIDDVE